MRLLSELAVTAVEPSSRNFGGRFGQLFALSDSISLSETHAGLADTPFTAHPVDPESINGVFLQSQQKILDSIHCRFVSDEDDGRLRHRFPALRAGATKEQLSGYDAYQGFYVTLQREMDREIQYLLSVVRDAAAGLCSELAQLVVIDQALGDTLSNHSRKLLAQVPRLLSLRFEFLRQQHFQSLFHVEQDNIEHWLKSEGWLNQFRLDMHRTALAELELRLFPALGLLEAIHAYTATAPAIPSAPTQTLRH